MENTEDLFRKCPYFTAQKVFAGKWAIMIMHHLSDEPLRFGELRLKYGD